MTVWIPPLSLDGEKKRKDGMKDGGENESGKGEGRVHSDHPRTTL